jgi:hypothetical protein
MKQEMFDADAADPGTRRPARERIGRVVGPRHQPRRHPVATASSHAAVWKERTSTGPRSSRARVQQLIEQHRRLARRGPVTVTQAGMPELVPLRLARPAAQCRTGAQPRVVQPGYPRSDRRRFRGHRPDLRAWPAALLATSRVRARGRGDARIPGQPHHDPQGLPLPLRCRVSVTDPLSDREHGRQAGRRPNPCARGSRSAGGRAKRGHPLVPRRGHRPSEASRAR